MEKKRTVRLTLKQWAICYAGSLGFGGVTWWATGSPWIGGGVLVGFTAVHVFSLAAKARDDSPATPAEGLSRQQRRALDRKNKDK